MAPAARIAAVIIATLLIPILPFAISGELPGERWLDASDGNALRFGATGAALLASDVLLPIPSSILGSLLGARLGLVTGFAWCWTGLFAGNLIGYFAGYALLGRIGAELPRTPTLLLLFLSRPVPVLAEAVTLAAGAARVPLLPVLLGCAAGNAVYALALCANGATLLPAALAGPGLILPMALPVLAWLVWQLHARRSR